MVRLSRSSVNFGLLDRGRDSPLRSLFRFEITVRTLLSGSNNCLAISATLTPAESLLKITPFVYGVSSLRRMIFGEIGPNGLRGMMV